MAVTDPFVYVILGYKGMHIPLIPEAVMKSRLLIKLSVLLLAVPLSMGSVLQQKGNDKPGTPHVYKGTEISVVSLEKTKEYKDVFGRKLTAKPGFDILVVKLKFKMATSELKFDMCRLNGELESTGKGYTVMSSPGDEVTYDITFALPEGTPLNTFHLDDLTFDIKKFDPHKELRLQ
jgi:hypothetical protein